jgi:hypothetical protein
MRADATALGLGPDLERLDLLLHREVLRLRAAYQLSLDEFRGLYISDQQVDELLLQAHQDGTVDSSVEELTAMADQLGEAIREDPTSPLQRLAQRFNLDPLDRDVLLLALAPEIDLKYETLFAYLNNDVTRKWPTTDLATRLLANDPLQMLATRSRLSPDAPLLSEGLVVPIEAGAERRPLLASGFAVAEPVARVVLGLPFDTTSLQPWARVQLAGNVTWDQVSCAMSSRRQLQRLAVLIGSSGSSQLPLVVLEGPPGSGRRTAAQAMCSDLELGLVELDWAALQRNDEATLRRRLQSLMLHTRLFRLAVCVRADEISEPDSSAAAGVVEHFFDRLRDRRVPILFSCAINGRRPALSRSTPSLVVRFDDLDYHERTQMWQAALAEQCCEVGEEVVNAVADRFVLTPSQIRCAAAEAVLSHHLSSGEKEGLDSERLREAARSQSSADLGRLASRVPPLHGWDDLVLPDSTLERVREIVAAIEHRHVVFGDWGFARRLGNSSGLMALFSGVSGTGKTMTAAVIARELGLELYRIDLSAVVSKYIGETEKNLDRIFTAARRANGILFFDEADALFGKRSEVKDAHDRYANIEIAYLLQKMEDYEGVAILASNLGRNIDQAFSRRMHFVVDFPRPSESHRERLWKGMFPRETPLGDDIDLPFLARQFELTGGDIRTVALDAVFMAARNSKVVTMATLIKAMARQMIKQGKAVSVADFKQYHQYLSHGS